MGLTSDEQAALEELEWELSGPHTQEEIASRLGVSQKTVCVTEQRALRKLRAMLDPDWQGPNVEHKAKCLLECPDKLYYRLRT